MLTRLLKKFNNLLIEDFFDLPPVSTTPVVHSKLQKSLRIFKKILNGPVGLLWGWGETDSWKNLKLKKIVFEKLRICVRSSGFKKFNAEFLFALFG